MHIAPVRKPPRCGFRFGFARVWLRSGLASLGFGFAWLGFAWLGFARVWLAPGLASRRRRPEVTWRATETRGNHADTGGHDPARRRPASPHGSGRRRSRRPSDRWPCYAWPSRSGRSAGSGRPPGAARSGAPAEPNTVRVRRPPAGERPASRAPSASGPRPGARRMGRRSGSDRARNRRSRPCGRRT
jgi:hypothetical protein